MREFMANAASIVVRSVAVFRLLPTLIRCRWAGSAHGGWVSMMSWRRASRSPTAPKARAWISPLPSAVASTGPAITGSACVGGQLAQQSVAGATADDVHDIRDATLGATQ